MATIYPLWESSMHGREEDDENPSHLSVVFNNFFLFFEVWN